MGMPVVTVASGGLPVVDVTATTGRGTPISEATNGFGTPVTKVASGGMPVAYVTVGGSSGPPLDGLAATGAWSFSRQLLTAYAGSKYSATAGAITLLNDQSGSANNLTDGSTAIRRPTETTAGPNNRQCGDWNGTSNDLTSNNNLSTIIAPSSGFIVVSAIIKAIVRNGANAWSSDPIWNDDGNQSSGMYVKNTAGGIGYAFNWDTNADVTPNSTVISLNTPYVFSWRHDTGIVYFGINGVETSIASGNTLTLSGPFYLGGDGVVYGSIKVFEVASWSVVPNATTRNAVIADFKNWCGA